MLKTLVASRYNDSILLNTISIDPSTKNLNILDALAMQGFCPRMMKLHKNKPVLNLEILVCRKVSQVLDSFFYFAPKIVFAPVYV